MSTLRVKQSGSRVLLGTEMRLIADMPWEAALELAKAIMSKAKLAEEHANADSIIRDHAILARAGVPIGLSNNRLIQEEVKKEACYNRDLRRYMPGGVKSREIFGVPRIAQRAIK